MPRPGGHEPGKRLEDQGWTLLSEQGVWRAYRYGLVLTVSRLIVGGYRGEVEGRDVQERSSFDTRLSAEEWCERRAESRRET